VALKLVYDHHFPPIRYKVRRWRKLDCKTIQYSRTSSNMWLEYILGCWIPLPRSDPSKMNLYFCKRLVFEAYAWRMSSFMTVLTWMKIKIMIFHMAKLVTMLACNNLLWLLWKRTRIWNSWRWSVMKKSSTMELDGFWLIWNMKEHILFISKTSCVLVMEKLFPGSDGGLGKCILNFCFF